MDSQAPLMSHGLSFLKLAEDADPVVQLVMLMLFLAAPKLSQLQKPVIVTLAADGAIYAGDERLDRDRLEAQLSALRPKEGDATVYVRADRKAAYGDVLELLGRIGQAGYRRISLLSQPLDAASRASGAAEAVSITGGGRR
jgi:hypothetical protein